MEGWKSAMTNRTQTNKTGMLELWLQEINSMADGKYAKALSRLCPLMARGYSASEIDSFIDRLALSDPSNYDCLKWTSRKNFGIATSTNKKENSASAKAGDNIYSTAHKTTTKKAAGHGPLVLASLEDLGEGAYNLTDGRYFPLKHDLDKNGKPKLGKDGKPKLVPSVQWSKGSSLMSIGEAAEKSSRAGVKKFGYSLSRSCIVAIDLDSSKHKHLLDYFKDKTFVGYKTKEGGTLSAHLFFTTDKLVPRILNAFGLKIDLLGIVASDSEKVYFKTNCI